MNNKIIIKEAETTTVNDEQLMGLYDAAAKTEGQIINLSVAAMKFSNPDIKRAVTSLKSQANQLVMLIAKSMEDNNGSDLGLMTGDEQEQGPQSIERNPSPDDMIEGTQSNGSAMNIMESKAKKVIGIMKENGITLDEALRLFEKFDPSIFDKNKKKEKADDSDDPDEDADMDISEACEKIKDGMSTSQIEPFKEVIVKEIEKESVGKNKLPLEKIKEAFVVAKDVKSINEALASLYNYCDKNSIKIKS